MPAASETAASRYRYLPTESSSTNQSLSFTYRADRKKILIGEVKASLFVRSNRPVTDIILTVEKRDRTGKAQYFTQSTLGRRTYGADRIQKVETENCPVNVVLDEGESVVVSVTSNLFPSFMRVSETDKLGRYVFREGEVELFHSAKFPSSFSWMTVP